MPPMPRELFEPIHVADQLPLYHPNNGAPGNPLDGSWSRERLERFAKESSIDDISPYRAYSRVSGALPEAARALG